MTDRLQSTGRSFLLRSLVDLDEDFWQQSTALEDISQRSCRRNRWSGAGSLSILKQRHHFGRLLAPIRLAVED
jgi:hypothetical protein